MTRCSSRLLMHMLVFLVASVKAKAETEECLIITLLPFSSKVEDPERPAHIPFSHMAAGLLAMEHFNARNPEVISELQNEEFVKCSVQFTLPHGDNDSDGNDTTTISSIFANDGDKSDLATRSILDYLYYLREQKQSPCAVVGSLTNTPAEAAAVIAAASKVPFITHAADIARIGRFPVHPMSTRTVVDEYSKGEALVDYLKNHRQRDYIYTLFNIEVESAVKVIDMAAKEHGMTTRSIAIVPPFSEDSTGPGSVYDAIRTIKESGFRTIVVAVSRMFLWNPIAREAQKAGLTGENGYLWIAYDSSDMQALTSTPMLPGSDRDLIFRGAGTVRVLDGFEWPERAQNDPFLNSWKRQGPDFVNRVNAMNPLSENTTGYFFAKEDYFSNTSTEEHMYPIGSLASFLYDSIMAVGMGACRRQAAAHNNTKSNNDVTAQKTKGFLQPTESDLFNEIVKVEFDGASGYVKLDDGRSYTRDPSTVAFGSYNFRPSTSVDPTTGERPYEYVLTSIKLPGQQWTKVEDFIFADGTTDEPRPLRDIAENNYLGDGVQIVGFVLFGVSAAIGAFGLLWIFVNRNTAVVRATQPEFLAILCVGSIITSCAILSISFDESDGWTEMQLSRACMTTPFLFVMGYVIAYSALFSKLWRIEKLLRPGHRLTIRSWQAVRPATVLLLVTPLTILIVWTVVDPLQWERETVDDFTGETFGSCSSDSTLAFVVPLLVVMFTATLLVGRMAWKTKDISEELSEAKWIFYAIFAQVQCWVASIPIIILVRSDGSAEAAYLGSVLVIWTFAVTIVFLIVGPRIYEVSFQREPPSKRSNVRASSRVIVSGMAPSSGNATPFGSWGGKGSEAHAKNGIESESHSGSWGSKGSEAYAKNGKESESGPGIVRAVEPESTTDHGSGEAHLTKP